MIFEPFRPFLASEFRVKFATNAWERAGAATLRHKVFCQEQSLFGPDDRDDIDAYALPIVALSSLGIAEDEVVGTVRIHEAEPGIWWGSRLAVSQRYRKAGYLGTALIQLAVCAAHARGCTRFLAHVQAQNGLLFHRLHWRTLGKIELLERPHLHMEADLDFYPPFHAPETGFLTHARRAA